MDGDILPPQIIEEEEMDNENENENEKRNARRDRSYLWRNRVVPYFFDVSLSKLSLVFLISSSMSIARP